MYSKLIRDITDAMQRDNVPIELLVDLSAEYSEACETTSERLETVGDLLTAGYREEAIAMAERAPRLLESLDELNFPERGAWQQFLADNNLDICGPLVLDQRQDLEFAYQISENMSVIMTKHRLLALARAPISSRLSILRNLAERDPTNPIWKQDIKKFEQERLSKMSKEFRVAKANDDTKTLDSLAGELAEEWTTPVPSRLKTMILESQAEMERAAARSQMEDVASQLNDCLVQFDTERGKQLRGQWNELNQIANVNNGDPIHRQAYEPLMWLRELDEADGRQLEADRLAKQTSQMIMHNCSLERLDKLLESWNRLGEEIPPKLQVQIDRHRKSLTDSQRKKSAFRRISISTIATIVALLIAWYWISRNHSIAVQKAVDQLTTHNQELDFLGAKTFVAALPANVRGNSRVSETWNLIQKNESRTIQLHRDFEEKYALFNFEGDLGATKDASISELRRLAQNKDLTRVEELQNKLVAMRGERQQTRNDRFQGELTVFNQKAKESLRLTFNASRKKELANLENSVKQWALVGQNATDHLPAVSAPLLEQASNLLVKLKNKSSEFEIAQKKAEGLSRLDRLVGNSDAFASALSDYCDDFPNDRLTAEFSSSANEARYWQALTNWQLVAANPLWDRADSLNSLDAKRLAEAISGARPNNPQFPFAADVKAALKQLKDASDESALPTGSFADQLKSFLDTPQFRSARVVVAKKSKGDKKADTRRWYIQSDTPSQTKTHFHYFIDPSFQETKSDSLPAKLIETTGLAGHCTIARNLLKILANEEQRSDSQIVVELLETAIESEPNGRETEVDLFVQAIIINEVLTLVKNAGFDSGGFAEKYIQQLKLNGIGKHNWVRPSDIDAMVTRSVLEEFLLFEIAKELPGKIETIRGQTKTIENKISDWRDQVQLKWTGWIYKTSDGWTVSPTPTSPSSSRELYCLVPSKDGLTRVAIVEVGQLRNKQFVAGKDSSALVSGRPVFVRSSD